MNSDQFEANRQKRPVIGCGVSVTARDVESIQLARCVEVAQGVAPAAQDQQEANIFRVAAMVIQSQFPHDSARLMRASDDYFADHLGDQLPVPDVVRRGWVLGLPRLRDMLTSKLTLTVKNGRQ